MAKRLGTIWRLAVAFPFFAIGFAWFRGGTLRWPAQYESIDLTRSFQITNDWHLHPFQPRILGAESFCEAPDGRVITGLADGRIVFVYSNGTGIEEIVRTGDSRVHCGDPEREPACGRPLGLKWDHYSGSLIVCDGYFGLMAVDIDSKQVRQLVLHNVPNDTAVTFCNSVVPWGDGRIYFTDSSRHYRRNRVFREILDPTASGRLLLFDQSTGETRVVMDNLEFANGLDKLSDSELVLAELHARRLWKVTVPPSSEAKMKGSAERASVLAENLPFYPDNVAYDSTRRILLVGSTITIHERPAFLRFRAIRALLLLLPYEWLSKLLPVKLDGFAVEMNTKGGIIGAHRDREGLMKATSEAFVTKSGEVYVGSFLGTSPLLVGDLVNR
eukprot:GHVU01144271.1.p1 GENE.GHVU01144271.1~~GHVU01144271.1.p1  ORF type:complete len:386 (+),score=28.01 GHVU01144271.1:1546-2703(+)